LSFCLNNRLLAWFLGGLKFVWSAVFKIRLVDGCTGWGVAWKNQMVRFEIRLMSGVLLLQEKASSGKRLFKKELKTGVKLLSGSDFGFEGSDSFFEDGEFVDINLPLEGVLHQFHVSFDDFYVFFH
jgi:hypothetical protein